MSQETINKINRVVNAFCSFSDFFQSNVLFVEGINSYSLFERLAEFRLVDDIYSDVESRLILEKYFGVRCLVSTPISEYRGIIEDVCGDSRYSEDGPERKEINILVSAMFNTASSFIEDESSLWGDFEYSDDESSFDDDDDFDIFSGVMAGEEKAEEVFIVGHGDAYLVMEKDSEPVLLTESEVKNAFPPSRTINLNYDGLVRTTFRGYLHLPVRGRKKNEDDMNYIQEVLESPIPPGSGSYKVGVVSSDCRYFFDGTYYYDDKGKKSVSATPSYPVVLVSDAERRGMWIPPDKFKRLSQRLVFGGAPILKSKGLDVDVLTEVPPEPDYGDDQLYKRFQALVDTSGISKEDFVDYIMSEIDLVCFPFQYPSTDESNVALAVGQKLEKFVKDHGSSVKAGITAIAPVCEWGSDMIQVLNQVWDNRNAVVHSNWEKWKNMNYFAYDWSRILFSPGRDYDVHALVLDSHNSVELIRKELVKRGVIVSRDVIKARLSADKRIGLRNDGIYYIKNPLKVWEMDDLNRDDLDGDYPEFHSDAFKRNRNERNTQFSVSSDDSFSDNTSWRRVGSSGNRTRYKKKKRKKNY